MNISHIKNNHDILFNGKKKVSLPENNGIKKNPSNSNFLLGTLLALAALAYPGAEIKSHNQCDDAILTEQTTPSGDIPPSKVTKNFHQGSDVGNCVGVAVLKAFTQTNAGTNYLNSLVSQDNNKNFIVLLPNKKPITINKDIINKYNSVIGNDYVEAITFALYKDAGNLDDNGNMKQGKQTNPANISLNTRGTFQRLTGIEPNCSDGSLKDLIKIEQNLKEGKNLLMTTAFNDSVRNLNNYQVFSDHEFTITNVNLKNNTITLMNPWYQNESEKINLSVEDFQKYNIGINLLEMQSDGKNITFSNSDIGLKPGEINYDFYFDIINYEPIKEDYKKYFEKNDYKKGENNEFTLSFWHKFDKDGFDYYEKKPEKRLSKDEISENMKTYTLLRNEGYTPISLVKNYSMTETIPAFKNKSLKNKNTDIQNWLRENKNIITYDIQIKHYLAVQKAQEKERQKKIIEKQKAEEERNKAEKAEELRQLKIYNDSIIEKLKTEAFNFFTTEEEGYCPEVLSEYKSMYPNYKIISDSNGRKIMSGQGMFQGEREIIKFDKNGHILSDETKDSGGKIINSIKYTYPDKGKRICTHKGNYGNYTELEIYDKKGKPVAHSLYDEEKLATKTTTYTTAPNGDLITKSLKSLKIFKGEKYRLETNFEYQYEYEFNDDGSVKKELEKHIHNGRPTDITATEHCPDGTKKLYWNNELKAIQKENRTYDINGNELHTYILKNLPSKEDE